MKTRSRCRRRVGRRRRHRPSRQGGHVAARPEREPRPGPGRRRPDRPGRRRERQHRRPDQRLGRRERPVGRLDRRRRGGAGRRDPPGRRRRCHRDRRPAQRHRPGRRPPRRPSRRAAARQDPTPRRRCARRQPAERQRRPQRRPEPGRADRRRRGGQCQRRGADRRLGVGQRRLDRLTRPRSRPAGADQPGHQRRRHRHRRPDTRPSTSSRHDERLDAATGRLQRPSPPSGATPAAPTRLRRIHRDVPARAAGLELLGDDGRLGLPRAARAGAAQRRSDRCS